MTTTSHHAELDDVVGDPSRLLKVRLTNFAIDAFLIAFGLVTSIVSMAAFGLGCVLSVFVIFLWIAILAVHVYAIITGLNGKRFLIPGVSEYADRF